MRNKLLIIFLLITVSTLFAKNKIDDRVKSFNVSPNGLVYSNLSIGDLIVNSWDNNKVEVKVVGIRERNLDDYSITNSGSEIEIRYNGGGGSNVKFYITVPVQFNLDLNTMNGDIYVKNKIEGYVNLKTSGGDLKVNNVIGDVELNTSGGNINTGDIDGKSSISTMGGQITCGSFYGSEAEISTMGGDIKIYNVNNSLSAVTYGGDVTVRKIEGTAKLKTFGGDIEVASCTGDVKIETFGGDLRLNSSSGNVIATTSGGDIRLYKLTGSVEAQTSGGDVKVEINPASNSENLLESSGGDVTLIIPSSANTEIIATIELHGNWTKNKDEYEIKSYIESSKLDYNKTSKEIIGQYILNNPNSIIYLNTSNGDIKIKPTK